MEVKAIDHGVNAVCMEKGGIRYGMINAWAMQVSAERMLVAIGPQSATGQAIEKGDTVGFSNLAKGQERVVFALGDMERHSGEADKLEGIDVHQEGSAITIAGARSEAVCRVLDVLSLDGLGSERVFYLEMVGGSVDGAAEAMHISDLGMPA